MVRAHVKQTPDEKKDNGKKKTPAKKKVETGSWPCKINGCNKVFAREADLKRHQRTTKLHSLPGFACPQCDATFTRTDALRRHQKSRHNGVVIEPSTDYDQSRDSRTSDADGNSSGSEEQDASRGGSPAHVQPHSSPAASTSTNGPSPSTSTGPSSYYRAHTMTSSYGARPVSTIEHHYPSSIGLPTSATRLHQASWAQPTPPPWADPSASHQSSLVYQTPSYFHPSPYYRQHYHPSSAPSAPPHVSRSPSEASRKSASPMDEDGDGNVDDGESEVSAKSEDPRPQQPEERKPTAEEMYKIAQAAIQVLTQFQRNGASASHQPFAQAAQASQSVQPPEGASPAAADKPQAESTSAGTSAAEQEQETKAEDRSGVEAKTSREAGLENMLTEMTEDGEPILSPGELLTQESLASPPPP